MITVRHLLPMVKGAMTMSAERQSSSSAARWRTSATVFPLTLPMQPRRSQRNALSSAGRRARSSPYAESARKRLHRSGLALCVRQPFIESNQSNYSSEAHFEARIEQRFRLDDQNSERRERDITRGGRRASPAGTLRNPRQSPTAASKSAAATRASGSSDRAK
jgi:hypothetical protein